MNQKARDDYVRQPTHIWAKDGHRFVTDLQKATLIVKSIVSMMEKLLKSTHDLFEIVNNGTRSYIHKDKLGEAFIRCLKFDLVLVDKHFPIHRHSPLFIIFKRFSRDARHHVAGRLFSDDVIVLNACVVKLRAFTQGEALGRRLANLRRGERKNRGAFQQLLLELRSNYSKLLAVRLDLGYYSDFSAGGPEAQQISLSEMRAHRDLFLAHLRTGPYSKSLVGYIWRLEYGLEKGHHLHLAILFNGQMVTRDINIANAIGHHWKEVATEGKGMFYNCNQNKERYEKCGIGMVNRTDEIKWEALKGALGYLTKQDMYLQFRPGPPVRTFGVGGPYNTASRRARVRRMRRLSSHAVQQT